MQFVQPVGKSELEQLFLKQIEDETPAKIKSTKLIDCNHKESFEFTLTRAQLDSFNDLGDGLGIDAWFQNYEKEALVSTAGIRGLQNPLYPWDTRYPINFVGITLATMGKILAAKNQPGDHTKVAACEVRYNSSEYVELIARLQAANGIKTLVTDHYMPIPIFLISFIIFMYDLYGGEYVTSSHAISRKIATKDLNAEGSQYIPSESMLFLDQVRRILAEIRSSGSYTFNFAAKNDPLLDRDFLKSIENGIGLYTKYLQQGVATPENLKLIEQGKHKVVIECMGGSIAGTLDPILQKLGIRSQFDFIHEDTDPFFHQIGKTKNQDDNFIDLSCDTTIMQTDSLTHKINIPVVNTIPYASLLQAYPIGTTLLMADPDADRLVTAYIDHADNGAKIQSAGLVYGELGEGRILVLFTPNQSFLMTFDFQARLLKQQGLWDRYNWFMLKTSASQHSWDEWCAANGIPVVNTPVGFKELADSMQQVEKKLSQAGGTVVQLKDVFGENHSLGTKPRLLFAGEESGGMIFGPPELIQSKGGRVAISMREKSAGEAIIITSALSAWLEQNQVSMADYLIRLYEENHIKSRYEIRIDQRFYNENEPDITKLLAAKSKGMELKTHNNSYFLSLALALKDGLITLDQARAILTEAFPSLSFTNLNQVLFCGDGTYLSFDDKTLEVRPSGTDAVNKGYGYGLDQWDCIKYAQALAGYDGTRTTLHQQFITQSFYDNAEQYAFKLYTAYKENQ